MNTLRISDFRADLLLGSSPPKTQLASGIEAEVSSFLENGKALKVCETCRTTGEYNGHPEEVLILRIAFRSTRVLVETAKRLAWHFRQDSVGLAFRESATFLRITPDVTISRAYEPGEDETAVQLEPESIFLVWEKDPKLIRKGGDMIQPYRPLQEWNETFQVNLHLIRPEHDRWLKEKAIPARYFVDLDAGGINFYTIEFPDRATAREFITAFGYRGEPWPYATEKPFKAGWVPFRLNEQTAIKEENNETD